MTSPITDEEWDRTFASEWLTAAPSTNGHKVNGHHKPAVTSGDEVEDEVNDTPATWAPQDLTDILNGTYVPETPALFPRSDGKMLLYRGRVHSLHGESESGKSLVVQAEVARVLNDGGTAVYIDYESDAAAVVGRLLDLGVPAETIRERFTYIHPETSPTKREAEREAWAQLLARRVDLAVIDGVTDALGASGAKTNDNDEIAAWCRNIARRIARSTGAAVVLIDHVTKDAESRGRYALGGQAKMNALDGSAYMVEVVEVLGRGLRGVVALRVAKDRPGGVRATCGPFRKSDRTQEAARIVVDSRVAGRITVTVEAPEGMPDADGVPKRFRPTHLMERVSRFMMGSPETSLNELRKNVPGKASGIDEAASVLADEGFLSERMGPRKARMFTHIRLYTEFQDPAVRQPEDQDDDGTSSPPRPHLVPDEVRRPRPRPPLPEGDEDEVDGVHEDPQNPTSSQDEVDAHGNCRRCGHGIDTLGHEINCPPETEAA